MGLVTFYNIFIIVSNNGKFDLTVIVVGWSQTQNANLRDLVFIFSLYYILTYINEI